MFEYGRYADQERLNQLIVEKNLIFAKLNKMPDGKLDSTLQAEICDINHPYFSTLTARYYKGIGSHKDNLVIEVIEDDIRS